MSSQDQFPQKFGKYFLLRKIAMGGMAEIFRAKTVGAEGFEKDIVIKRILPHYTEDEDFVKMFIDEATVTSRLQHANIVQIFDFNVEDGSYYIAMEYVEGKDLKKIVETGLQTGKPLTVEQCVWIVMELSKGLHYAHQKTHKGKPLNIVHRDISPQNAMISFNGEVKLMDFGIAKAASRSTKTVAGTVKGKCAYMSPEQARGKPLDGRSDLFALAVVVWEMLTHKRLFLGDSDFVTLSNVLKQEAPPPSSINPDIPPEIDEIVLKALEKDRDDRYANVEDFNRALTKWFYANVDDLDAAALGPVMKELFAGDIADLQDQQAEEKTMFMTADEPDAPGAEQATVALSLDDAQQAKTVLDDDSLTAERVREALAAAQAGGADAATRALPLDAAAMAPTGTGTAGVYVAPKKGGKGWLIALLAILLLGGGGFAAYWFGIRPGQIADSGKIAEENGGKGKDGDGKTKKGGGETDDEYATLTITYTPKDAEPIFEVNGAPIDGSVADELELGEKIKLTAVADGFEPFKTYIKIERKKQEFKVELKKKTKLIRVAIQAVCNDCEVIVDGKSEVKGNLTKGVSIQRPAGTEVEVAVKDSTGKLSAAQKIAFKEGGQLVYPFAVAGVIPTPGPPTPGPPTPGPPTPGPPTPGPPTPGPPTPGPGTGPPTPAPSVPVDVKVAYKGQPPKKLKLAWDPASLQVVDDITAATATTPEIRGWIVKGAMSGNNLKLKLSAAGYYTDVKVVPVTAGMALPVEVGPLKKKPTTPGDLRVNARPWAKCCVRGTCKMTPFTIKTKPGPVKVKCTARGKTKSKRVNVPPGGTATAVITM